MLGFATGFARSMAAKNPHTVDNFVTKATVTEIFLTHHEKRKFPAAISNLSRSERFEGSFEGNADARSAAQSEPCPVRINHPDFVSLSLLESRRSSRRRPSGARRRPD